MNLSLEGKYAVVCGSSQGIGSAVAEELALMGAHCTLLARNEESLKAAINNLDTSLRQLHHYVVVDFSDSQKLRSVITEITAQHMVHILINNSGGPAPGKAIDANEDDYLKAFQQHLVANHILAQAVVPGMKEEKFGRIVNIISTSVKIPLPNLGVSNTIRGAVASWSKTLSNELAEFGITVNNVLPGFTQTARLKSLVQQNAARAGKTEEEIAAQMIQSIPAKRFGSAEEIAAVVAFLCSPAAAYVNGESIRVDGGRTGSI